MNDSCAAGTNKWLGIDYGRVRVGIAVSDALGILARGLETLTWDGRDLAALADQLSERVQSTGAVGVVIGLPRRTDGKHSQWSEHVEELQQLLHERIAVPVLLRDERFTTVIADQRLEASGVKTRKRRQVIDQVAATVILQDHLDSMRRQ